MASSFVIDVYSHHIVVTGFSKQGKDTLLDFCATRVGQKGLVFVGHGQYTMKLIKLFAAATKNRREFRFHRNSLTELMAYLHQRMGSTITIEVVHHEATHGVACEFNVNKGFEPRENQLPIIEYLTSPQTAKLVAVQTGQGKFSTLDSPIKVPGGWRRMGDLVPGDIVTGVDGHATEVTGVFPQGEHEIYRVTFYDGRSTLVGGEHLWRVYYVNTVKHRRWRTVDTLEVKRLISMPNPRVYVPLCESEVGDDVPLPLDPWVLGVLIGDGGISNGAIVVTTPDQFILDKLNSKVPVGMEFVHSHRYSHRLKLNGQENVWKYSLMDIGLWGKRCWEKFIPTQYLNASTEQRWELLQGLMDTDGTIGTSGTSSYCTTSPQLAKDVAYLVRSLGGIATISEKEPFYTYKGERLEGRLAYNIFIRVKTPSKVFTLPKKKERTNDDNQYAKDLKLAVRSVEPVGKMEAQCISVAHPDKLYITDDFIVTHNTVMSLSAVQQLAMRTAIIVPGKYVDKWIGDCRTILGVKPGELMVIRGSKDLKRVIDLAICGELTAQILIITSTTLFNFIKDYELSSGSSDQYACKPQELFQTLGVGVRLMDEVHQNFHLNFKIDLYTHAVTSIDLSATVDVDDAFMDRMYKLKYPMNMRYSQGTYDKYIAVTALHYKLKPDTQIRTSYHGMTQYSHTAFEEFILKRKKTLASYLALLEQCVKNLFLVIRKPGQKLLVFASTKEMCAVMAKDIMRYSPNLKVGKYVSEDDYQELMTNDITVSTYQSSGTAVDIPGLRVSICTTAIQSRQANEQMLGRLRRLKDYPDETPEYYYFVCEDIDKHVEYSDKKFEYFKDKVLSHKVAYLKGGL